MSILWIDIAAYEESVVRVSVGTNILAYTSLSVLSTIGPIGNILRHVLSAVPGRYRIWSNMTWSTSIKASIGRIKFL